MNESHENQEPGPVPPHDNPAGAVPPHDGGTGQEQPPGPEQVTPPNGGPEQVPPNDATGHEPPQSRQEQTYSPGSARPAYPGPAPQPSARFFVWLRSLGVRRGSSRWVGGVCSGLAEKWGIDPVIVRGLAVVLTLFFGVGLLAYGVAWALLPEPDGRIHVEQVARGHWSTGMTGAAVATFLGMAGPGQSVAWNGHGGWVPWPVLWVAAIVAIIVWAVNRGKDGPARAAQGPHYQQQQFGAAGSPGQAQRFDAAAAPGGAPQYAPAPGAVPYAAEPLTGNSGTWTGRNLGPTGPLALKARPRLGAAATLLSLGLAVMVGALVLILNASGVLNLHGYHVAAAAAAAAITAGLAIIFSGLRGRSAGGVGTFAIIALVVAGLLSMVPQHAPWTPMANQSWAPTTVSAAQDGLSVAMGGANIDLTGFDAGSALAGDVQIPVSLVAAKAVLKVPTSIPVTIKSDLAVSSLEVQGQPGNDGKAVVQSSTTHINPEATGNGLVVTLEGAAANVTIIPVAGK